MGLLARLLLGTPRRLEEIPDLSVDLETLSLAGLPRAADRSAVTKRLGPPADFWESRRGSLRYPYLGLFVRLNEQGRLASYSVAADPDPQAVAKTAPFRGSWIPPGSPLPPNEAALVRILGQPNQRLIEEDEDCLEWIGPEGFVGPDFSLDGRLKEIYVDYDAEVVSPESFGSWEPPSEATAEPEVQAASEPEAALEGAPPPAAEDAGLEQPVGVEAIPFEQESPEERERPAAEEPPESVWPETAEPRSQPVVEPQEPPGRSAPPEKEDREVHPPVEVGAVAVASSSSKDEKEPAAVGEPTPARSETVDVDPHPELPLQHTGGPQERNEDAAAEVPKDPDVHSPLEVDAAASPNPKDEGEPAVVASSEQAHPETAAAALEPQGQPSGKAR